MTIKGDIHVLGGSIPVLLVAPDRWYSAVAVDHVGRLVSVY
jgi:(2Fe-2S) ferredoxin